MKSSHFVAIVLGVLGAARSTAQAQPTSSPGPGPTSTDSGGTALLSVPDIPALTALDATSSKLDRPDSASGFAVALANILTEDGSIRSGAAVEISPHAFGVDKKWTYFEYRDSLWRRILAQSALSIGTSRSSDPTALGTSVDTKAAIGARLVLINNADPLLAAGYTNAVEWARAECKEVEPSPARLACEVNKRPEYTGRVMVPWNASGLFVATAATWGFSEGKLKNHTRETLSTWIAGALPLSDSGQVAAGMVWDHGWFAEDKLTIAGRLRLGSEGFRFTGDGTWFVEHADGTASGRWAIGAEAQLSATSWLTLSAGTDIGGATASGISILSSIKYGFSPKPSWSPN